MQQEQHFNNFSTKMNTKPAKINLKARNTLIGQLVNFFIRSWGSKNLKKKKNEISHGLIIGKEIEIQLYLVQLLKRFFS